MSGRFPTDLPSPQSRRGFSPATGGELPIGSARRAEMHHDSQNISGFPHAVAGNCEFTAISSVTRSHETEAIMLSAMSLNVRRNNAGETAASSLGSREHSSTLAYMTQRTSSQARGRRGWPACGSLGRPHPDTPRVPDGREREPARPGRNDQWTTISASSSPRVDTGCITWRRKGGG